MGSFDAHCEDPMNLLGPRTIIDDRAHELGMSGAVNAAWQWAVGENLTYLFHIEEDFVFRRDFSLRAVLFALNWARAAQIVLKRQPWSPEEQAVGNVIRYCGGTLDPQDMHTEMLGTVRWVRHSSGLFSLNPCVLPFETFSRPYPAGNEAEITAQLRAEERNLAYFGGIDDPPIVEHVGHQRGAGWRL